MKTRRIILCALLATALLSAAAGAKTQQQRPVQPCEERGSQAEASGCAHREYQAADAELNKAYNRLAAILDADEKALLKTSELAWIKYRDADCTFESSQYAGGTMRPMIESFCLTRVTKARTAELNEQYELRSDK
ncbi:MAG: lysozyme inhibitor LprI family protein [Pyrinomonadaceae bacterium]